MAPLASIPEVSHPNLDSRINHSRQSKVSSFERARRRSRVLIISRQSSGLRRRAISPKPTAQLFPKPSSSSEESTESSCSQGKTAKPSATKQDDHFIQERANPVKVSEPRPPSQDTPARSDVSIDIDSFPLPPSHNNHSQPSHSSVQNRTKQPKVSKSTTDSRPANDLSGQRDYNKNSPHKTRSLLTGSHAHGPSSLPTKGVAGHTGVTSHADLSSNRNRAGGSSKGQRDNRSRSPSQAQALDTFTKELQWYAETVGAQGKPPSFTPTPSKSSMTLHTVSALLPFRSEFKAAGLAVTSKDQRHQGTRASVKMKAASRAPRAHHHGAINSKRLGVFQVDGKVNSLSEPTTVVDFTSPSNTDIWRKALVDGLPPRKNVLFPYRPRSRRSCLPCLPKRRVPLPIKRTFHRNRFGIAPGYVARLSKPPKSIHSSEYTDITSQNPIPHASEKARYMGTGALGNEDDGPTARVPKAGSLNAVLGLRRKHKIIPTPYTTKGKDRLQREKPSVQLFPHDYRAFKSSMDANNAGDVSYHGGKGNLQETRLQKNQRPPTRSQQPIVDYDALSIPELPPVHRRQAGKAPTLPSIRDFLADRLTAKAVREISRHDPGRYPVQLPPHLTTTVSSPKPPDIPCRVSSRRCQTISSKSSSVPAPVNDRDVLKGLHIAAAAACDESVHIIVHENTGLHVRRFLSELIAFDALGQVQQGDDKEQQARRRRAKIRKLKQQVRASRRKMQEGPNVI